MSTTYIHLTDTDKPSNQTALEASFVDANGKHVDVGGGTAGLETVHHDESLTGDGTSGQPLAVAVNHTAPLTETTNTVYPAIMTDKTTREVKGLGFNAGDGLTAYTSDDPDVGVGVKLSDEMQTAIEKGETLTEDNIISTGKTSTSRMVHTRLDTNGKAFTPLSAPLSTSTYGGVEVMMVTPATVGGTGVVRIGDNISVTNAGVISVPAITAIKEIALLSSSATNTDIINKINQLLSAVKNTQAQSDPAVSENPNEPNVDHGLNAPTI